MALWDACCLAVSLIIQSFIPLFYLPISTCLFQFPYIPLFTEGDKDDEEKTAYALQGAVMLTLMDAEEGQCVSLHNLNVSVSKISNDLLNLNVSVFKISNELS